MGFGLTRIPQISQVLLLRVLNLTEVGGHFRLTRIPQISQVLLLRVGNLTEVGGHFRLTRIPLLWVGFGLTPIQQEYSHGFRKKKIREIRGIRGFQSSTN